MPVLYTVKHVTSEPLVTVDVETSAQDAMGLMVENRIGALVVVERGNPVGILTERDILRRCCREGSCRRVKSMEIMSKPLITVDAETPIGKATEIMVDQNVRTLLVTKKGKIVGIVTHKDLMRGTLDAFRALDAALSMV